MTRISGWHPARLTTNTGLIRGDGAVPFLGALSKRMRLKSGFGSMAQTIRKSSLREALGEMEWSRDGVV